VYLQEEKNDLFRKILVSDKASLRNSLLETLLETVHQGSAEKISTRVELT
jgi:hypothetical protein